MKSSYYLLSHVRNRVLRVLSVFAFITMLLLPLPEAVPVASAASFNAGTYIDLVNAIKKASNGDTINLTGNITVEATVTVNKSLTFVGNNWTVDGGGKYLIFSITGGTVTFGNMSIANGKGSSGGGMSVTAGAVNLNAVKFMTNTATTGAGLYIGPPGSGTASATIASSTFQANVASNSGGGVAVSGAGASATITGTMFTKNQGTGSAVAAQKGKIAVALSRFDGNTNSAGGAINSDTSATIDQSTFTNNSASSGGAVYFTGGTGTVTRSTFMGNQANPNDGGAILIKNTLATITNSSFFTNTATSTGGAVATSSSSTASQTKLNINNATFYGNSAAATGGDSLKVGVGSATLRNSLLASIGSGNCVAAQGMLAGDHNVGTDGSCPGTVVTTTTGLKLALPPQNNGGATLTAALLTGSAAIGAGDPTTCVSPDQRGVLRPSNSCDAGAYQHANISVVVGTLADSGSGSLRQAIIDSNNHPTGPDTPNSITFSVTGVINLQSPLPPITEPVILDATAAKACTSVPPTLSVVRSGTTGTGLALAAGSDGSTVRGLAIGGFDLGVDVESANDTLECNFVGTDAAGAAASPNKMGIQAGTGANNKIQHNLISGNAGVGIVLNAPGSTTLVDNLVGTNSAATTALPNSGSGISITLGSNNNVIGGTASKQPNVIADNGGSGIAVLAGTGPGTGNKISGNSIYANGKLGIDLGSDGLTFNHKGTLVGPNNYQNFPVLTLATFDGASTARLKGYLDAAPNATYTVEAFANPSCDASAFGEGQQFLGTFTALTDGNGHATFDTNLSVPAKLSEPQGISTTATDAAGNTSEFSYCRPVSTTNLNWYQAQPITSSTSQYIDDRPQEKWFKFPVTPGAQFTVTLTGRQGSALTLHIDPNPIYNSLINPQSLAQVSAATGGYAFLASGFLPSGSLPSGSLPSGSLYSSFLPSGSLPSGSLPSGSLPSGSLPSGSLPSGSLPSGSPSSASPSSGSLPSGSLAFDSLPSGSLPSGSLPSGSLAAYDGAAWRSLAAVSLDPYATVQTISRNSYDYSGYLYVRVVGPYDITNQFKLSVSTTDGVCSDVGPVSGVAINGSLMNGAAGGAPKTLILTNSARLPGANGVVPAALQTLAKRPEVNGAIIDFANSTAYPAVAAAIAQDDAHTSSGAPCTTAKNILAGEMRRVVSSYRATYDSAIQYIVLAGGNDVIPYYLVADQSGLASEFEYVPPVAPNTASFASLRTNQVQTQDYYGSQITMPSNGHNLVLPDLPVGRLVDTAADVTGSVNTYVNTNGVIAPQSALITGYDFVGDAAAAIKSQVEAGIGGGYTADALIQNPGLPPTDPTAWTTPQLTSALTQRRHDIISLSGHFSAGNLLAADYTTSLSAGAFAAAPVDVTNALVMTLGCHGGYTIPILDSLQSVSPAPTWAPMLLRGGAIGYVASTGYAYGDTVLTEYGERLMVDFTQQLRTGSGSVAIGTALVNAKKAYLAGTAQLSGIDEKTVNETVLYGLPMAQVNLPGKLSPPADSSVAGSINAPDSGPGVNLGLKIGQPSFNPISTSQHVVPLTDLSTNTSVNATYYSGKDGTVANPYEPIFPKALYNVDVPNYVLRGVALDSAVYTDTAVTPLTVAATTETSVPHLSFNSSSFYPPQFWKPIYSDLLAPSTSTAGTSRLVLVPGQFQSTQLGAPGGVMRVYGQMTFRTYYLPSDWNGGQAAVKAAAVSAAPVIEGASVVSGATGVMTFTVNVLPNPDAGIQAVSVLYTGKPPLPGSLPSSLYGKWKSLDLGQPYPQLDPTSWQVTMTVPSDVVPADVQFMAQAVNGAGLVTLSSGLGSYYSLGNSTPSNAGPTKIALLTAASSGIYLQGSKFGAQLTSNGSCVPGLANQPIVFNLGGQQVTAFTNSSCAATATLTPVIVPGTYTLQASFPGAPGYAPASTFTSFAVNKDDSKLALTLNSGTYGSQNPVVATLTDTPPAGVAPRGLGGKPIVFVFTGSGGTSSFALTAFADYQGRVTLGPTQIPAGTYTVDAYFGWNPTPINGTASDLRDPYYNGQHVQGNLSLTQSTLNVNYTGDRVLPMGSTVHMTATVTAASGSSLPDLSTLQMKFAVLSGTSTVVSATVPVTASPNAGAVATAQFPGLASGIYTATATLSTPPGFAAAPVAAALSVFSAGGPYSVLEGQTTTVSARPPSPGPLTFAWDLTGSGTYTTIGQTVPFSAVNLGAGTQPIAVQGCDGSVCAVAKSVVNILNAPPVLSGQTSQTANQGQAKQFSLGVFADGPTDGPWAVDVNWGDSSADTTFTATVTGTLPSQSHTYASAASSYTVKVSVTDKFGVTGTASFGVTVNRPPVLQTLSATVAPVPAGTGVVTATATFTDLDTQDTHTATWNWGDGTTSNGTVTEANGSGTVNGTHSYAAVGEYTVSVTVTDSGGLSATAPPPSLPIVTVYDASGSYVTGGGWINSPAGAYYADPTITGKAELGVNAMPGKTGKPPSGSASFRFAAANLSFSSTSYSSLTFMTSFEAQVQGVGTINGASGYSFLITLVDGQSTGGGGTDLARVKIWVTKTGAAVYDTQPGAANNAYPTQAILAGGNIAIHQ